MPSIFDWLNPTPQTASLGGSPILGAADPAVPSILDTKAYRNQQLQDTLLGMSKALLQAGAPSPYPRGFADAFGAAGVGAAEGAGAGEDKYLKRALVDSQVQAAQDKMKQRKELRDLLLDAGAGSAAPSPTVGTASLTPGVSGSAGGTEVNPPEWEKHYDQAASTTGLSKEIIKASNWKESRFNPNAVSPAGAVGVAQLMPGTAGDLGVTNPRDPAQSIMAGAQYLKQMYTKYGNPDDALAAYNWGPGNMDKWIAGGRDPNQMPAETKDYIASIKGRLGNGGAPTTMTAQAAPAPAPAAPAAAPPAPPAAAGPQGFDFAGMGGAPPAAPPTPPVQVAGGPVANLPPMAAPPLGPQGGPVGGGEQPTANASGTPLPPQSATPVQYQPPAAPAAPVGPVAAPQVSNTVRQVVQNLKPAERQLLATMEPEAITKFLLERASPNQMTVLDSTNGAVVFVDKNDPGIGSRYQPVKAAELSIAMRNAAAQEKQAAAREEANRIRGANEPLQPGGTPTPGYVEQKGAVTKAEETAKVQPRAMLYQAENAIKDHEVSQNAAAKARSSNNNMARLETLLDGVDTGKMKSTTNDIKAYAKGLGIDIGEFTNDDVGRVQAAKSLLNQMALEMRNTGEGGGMPGSMSDSDRQYLLQIPPGIETTPEGRKMIIDYQKRVNQRTIDVARIKNEYMQSPEFSTNPAGMWAKVQQFADSHPMFDPAKDKLPTAASSAPSSAPTMSAIDAEIERRKKAK